MFATTDLIAPLAKRGIALSSSQVYRLVVERPERLSLKMLMALLDILDCTMDDLIEPVATVVGGHPSEEGRRRRGQRRRPAAQAGPHPRGRSIVTATEPDRAVADPIGSDHGPGRRRPNRTWRLDRIRSVVAAVAGGRAKSRRLASALAGTSGGAARRPVPGTPRGR